MRALTVQQPWAWAIVHGGKDIENRTQVWSYRGPLAIHAGARWSERGAKSPLVRQAVWDFYGTESPLDEPRFCSSESPRQFAAFLGVVDLVDLHFCTTYDAAGNDTGVGCCQPWGEHEYGYSETGLRSSIVHLQLANPRPLPVPIPCKGRLGLWTPPAEVFDELQAMA